MARTKRPVKNQPVPAKAAAPEPITAGNVFLQYTREANSLVQELEARRIFDADVGVYLKEVGLVDAFNAWRAAKYPPKT